MAIPTSRTEFSSYCLRKLGSPMINIDVTPEQIDDRIDQALIYYADYHFDGTDRVYYKYQITDADAVNRYITVPESLIGIISIFPVSSSTIATGDIFNIRYQIALNDMYNLTNTSLIPYFMAREQISLIQEFLVDQPQLRFNRHMNRVYIDANWNDQLRSGDFVVLEAYQKVDPDLYTDVWGDRWLANYCTALIKLQWGNNLSKFVNVTLPGGVTLNADRIRQEAEREVQKMEDEIIDKYSIPVMGFLE